MAERPISMRRRRWRALIRDLRERGQGRRESGAFLLADASRANSRVVRWACFDDLDPECLTGGISLAGHGFGRLWDLCHEQGMRVIADVHTHPGDWVGQSQIDRENPMIATQGHVGIIVPKFAQHEVLARDVGVHVYQGDHRWISSYDGQAAKRLRLTWW